MSRVSRTSALLLVMLVGCEHGPVDVPRTSSAQETLWVLLGEQVKLDVLRPLLVALEGRSFSPELIDTLSGEVERAASQVGAAANRSDELRAARYRADVVGVAYDLIQVNAEAHARGFGGALNHSCSEGMKFIREALGHLKQNPHWPVESPADATRTLALASVHAENAMRVAPVANFARSGVTAASLTSGAVSLARLGAAGLAGLSRLIEIMKGAGVAQGALAIELAGGVGSIRLPAGSSALELSRAEVLGLAQAGVVSAAALHLYMMATHLHHIATNKNYVSTGRGGPWSQRFEKIFKPARMTLDDEANLVEVEAHYGPHSEAYHREVHRALVEATKDVSPGTPQYQAALKDELRRLAKLIQTPGSKLNQLLTGR